MRNYDEALAAARPKRPFSNGTEGYAWMDAWCDQCVHDAQFQRTGEGSGCPLIRVALMGKTPVEWIDQRPNQHVLGDTYHCTEFRDVDDDGGDGTDDEPTPPTPDPVTVIEGQTDIFEVFADQVVEQAQRAAEQMAVAS